MYLLLPKEIVPNHAHLYKELSQIFNKTIYKVEKEERETVK
jgi:hypothetical protein